jgi:hypothetical protein
MRLEPRSSIASLSLLAFSLFSLGSLAACSNSTAPTASPFQGQWACSVVDALTFTTPPNGEPESNVTSPLLTVVADVSGDLSVTGLVDAGATCPLKLTSSGATATLTGGQTCTSGTISLAYGGGSATVTGSVLSVTLAYSFSGTVVAPGDGGTSGATTNESVAGTGTSTYTCTKNGS